jgi:hypothetical protein
MYVFSTKYLVHASRWYWKLICMDENLRILSDYRSMTQYMMHFSTVVLKICLHGLKLEDNIGFHIHRTRVRSDIS